MPYSDKDRVLGPCGSKRSNWSYLLRKMWHDEEDTYLSINEYHWKEWRITAVMTIKLLSHNIRLRNIINRQNFLFQYRRLLVEKIILMKIKSYQLSPWTSKVSGPTAPTSSPSNLQNHPQCVPSAGEYCGRSWQPIAWTDTLLAG